MIPMPPFLAGVLFVKSREGVNYFWTTRHANEVDRCLTKRLRLNSFGGLKMDATFLLKLRVIVMRAKLDLRLSRSALGYLLFLGEFVVN